VRIKQDKYYASNGSRRPASTYLYLGGDNKHAITWILNKIKYIAVFDSVAECYQFRRDNAQNLIGLFINIERKHVRRLNNGTHIVDYLSQEPAMDHYTGLPDDMHHTVVETRKQHSLSKESSINNLKAQKTKLICNKYAVDNEGDKIAIGIEIKNIEREISDINRTNIEISEMSSAPVIRSAPKETLQSLDIKMRRIEKKGNLMTSDDREKLRELERRYDEIYDSE
jgi:hypothetical protein